MPETSTRRPNLVYILSDQHSPFVTGVYGDPLVRTPHLDALAARGVTFENVYCPSPLCAPSRASMLTGRYPYQNEVWINEHTLDSGIPTIAHAIGAAGYWPVQIGRMHVMGPDQLHGYAERHVGDHSPNFVGGRPVDHGILAGTAGPARISLENSGAGQSAYQVHDEDVTAATVAYLDRLGVRQRAGLLDAPFALSIGFMLPHQPFVARREDYDLYDSVMTPPRHAQPYTDQLHPFVRWWREEGGIKEVSAEEVHRARTAYWGLVTRLDALIGEILAALERNGLLENTLILYTSDHGEQVGEHGLWWKQTFYEDSVRTPAILSWPGVLTEGARCDRVLDSLDLHATMLDLLGAPPLPNGVGRSIWPVLRDPAAPWEDRAISEYCNDKGWLCRMIRQGDWKLCYYHGYAPQLFNLADDPHELCDRASDPACATVRERLTAAVLDGWNPEWVAARMRAKSADVALLRDWARQVQPDDRHRWPLRPEMNRLERDKDEEHEA